MKQFWWANLPWGMNYPTSWTMISSKVLYDKPKQYSKLKVAGVCTDLVGNQSAKAVLFLVSESYRVVMTTPPPWEYGCFFPLDSA